MIDGPGRVEVVALLESLAAAGITVIHVTHRETEAAKADSTILMLAGRVVPPSLPGARVSLAQSTRDQHASNLLPPS